MPSIYYDQECGLDQYANRDKARRTRFRNLKFPKKLTKFLVQPSTNLLYVWPWTDLMISHGLKYYSPKARYSYHFERLTTAEEGLLLYTLKSLSDECLKDNNILERIRKAVFPGESVAGLKYRIKEAVGINLPFNSLLCEKENSFANLTMQIKKSKNRRKIRHNLPLTLAQNIYSPDQPFLENSKNVELKKNILSPTNLISNIFRNNEEKLGPKTMYIDKYSGQELKYLALLHLENMSRTDRRQLFNLLPYWWTEYIKEIWESKVPVVSVPSKNERVTGQKRSSSEDQCSSQEVGSFW